MSIADPVPGAAPAASTGAISPHLLPDSATVEGSGRLSVAGIELENLAAEFGTPLFVYDERTIRARCREAVAAFDSAAYATKAFLCRAIVEVVLGEGMNLDVSTGGELEVGLAAGASPDRMVLHGNNKSDAEIARSIEVGVGRTVVDSFDEIDRIARLSDGRRQEVLVRVNPGVEAHTHEFVSTGQVDSKFGLSLVGGEVDTAIERLSRIPGVEVRGLHAHIGSQIFRLDPFGHLVGALAPLLHGHGLGELSVGGGLGVAYLSSERAPSIAEWGAAVATACREAGIGPSVRVAAEPGRAIVATAGLTCYRIGTIKSVAGVRNYVSVDGGMSDNPRPVLYGSGYEAFLSRSADAARPFAARIVGKHCESGDVVVADAQLPGDVAVGDLLVTPVTGAYGFSMASNYNRLGRPAVVFVADGRARLVVRRETTDDLLRLEP